MPVFQKNLTDLVKGIRSNKKNEQKYINECILEIKDELKQNDIQKKSVAILKLVYLQMWGYEMSWASFPIIEVMSSTKFSYKRIGYLAASQSYKESTEVIMLATQLIRKDMTSSNLYEAGLAISCLSNICTPDLARDLAADVVSMLNSARPYVRKKSCLVLYKIFLKFPDALRPSFPRLKDKLEDPDPAVQAAAVNVICELARKNPKNYISLAPVLFKILTSSSNNWMLIKIVKLFGALLPIEKRLAKKLVSPLNNLINTTPAPSLLFECIQTCSTGLAEHVPTIRLCLNKLRSFVEDSDQNLKYLGLIALNNIMKVHPKSVAEHRDLVLNCLDDEDISIRMRALDLLEGMVNKKNLLDIIRKLVDHIEKSETGHYKDALVEKIVTICSKNSYQYITDFEWYISVLTELSRMGGVLKHGEMVSSQFMDIIIRVPAIRAYGIKSMVSLLRDSKLLSENPQEGGACEVLYAAAYTVGEFCSFVSNPAEVIGALLQSTVTGLPAHIQSVYINSALKLFAHLAAEGAPTTTMNLLDPSESSTAPRDSTRTNEAIKLLEARLPLFVQSSHLEVQERACFVSELLGLYKELLASGRDIGADIAYLFADPLNPVAPKAQKKVPIPEDLNLDEWINEPPDFTEGVEDADEGFGFLSKDESEEEKYFKQDPEELAKSKIAYAARNQNNPHYLKGVSAPAQLQVSEGEHGKKKKHQEATVATRDSPFYLPDMKSKRKVQATVNTAYEMPEGAAESDEDVDETDPAFDLASINLNTPLKPGEELPRGKHHISTGKEAVKEKKKRSGKSKRSKEKETKSKPQVESLVDMDLGFDPISSPVVVQEEVPEKQTKVVKKWVRDPITGQKKLVKKKLTKREPKKTSQPLVSIASSEPTVPVAEAQESKPNQPRYKPLCKDNNLAILYELRVSKAEPQKVMAAFALKNLSAEAVSGVTFEVKGTLNTRIAASSRKTMDSTLEAGETQNFSVLFDCMSFEQSQKLSGIVNYQVGGVPASKDFQLVFPSSSFIVPTKLGADELINLIRTANFGHSTSDVRPEGDFRSFIVQLATLLHVELITMDQAGATFYGRSIQDHHVAVYVKVPPPGAPVRVDLKSSSSTLAVALTSEVSNFFPRALL